MKKALFKIIIPLCVLVLWMITCYPVCNKADGFDYFLYWILVGCPYGIGDFKQYVGKTVVYNVYMDWQGKKPVRYSIYK